MNTDVHLSSEESPMEVDRPEMSGIAISATERIDESIGPSTKRNGLPDTRETRKIVDNDVADDDVDEEDGIDSIDDDSSSLSSALSSSSSSSSLSSDGDNQGEVATGSTLVERQARNIERNARFLGDLHEKYKDLLPAIKPKPGANAGMSSREKTGPLGQQDDNVDDKWTTRNDLWMRNSHRLFRSFPLEARPSSPNGVHSNGSSTSNRSFPHLIQLLNERYPHRNIQIRQLVSVLSPTITMDHQKTASMSGSQVYVPAPIFCLGPPGTAKTSIVCDVVEVLQSPAWPTSVSSKSVTKSPPMLTDDTESAPGTAVITNHDERNNTRPIPVAPQREEAGSTNKVRAAYIDCSILEPSSIERLVYAVYQQLRPSGSTGMRTPHSRTGGWSRAEKPKRKKRRGTMGEHSTPAAVNTAAIGSKAMDTNVDTTGTVGKLPSPDVGGTVRIDGSTTTTGTIPVWNDENVRDVNGHSHPKNVATNMESSLSAKATLDGNVTDNAANNSNEVNPNTNIQRRILPARGVKRAMASRTEGRDIGRPAGRASVRKKRNKGTNVEYDNEDSEDRNDTVETTHSAVLALGRSLQQYYGPQDKRSSRTGGGGECYIEHIGVLILDKADELMSLSSTRKKKKNNGQGGHSAGSAALTSTATNYLAELLLLPKIMKLNITVIVISNYALLDKTRLNNNVAPSKSLATISNGVHPILIQFPAYRGSPMFQDILTTKENLRLVMGNIATDTGNSTMRWSLRQKLVRVFWNTVIQSISDSTRNIHDFIRLGRALWPWFVAPLHPRVIRNTMEGIGSKLQLTIYDISRPVHLKKVDDEIAHVLGTRFHQYLASLSVGEESLIFLPLDETGIIPMQLINVSQRELSTIGGWKFHQPYFRHCLLLAAFICQNNKADQDKRIFSTSGNGRRRKNRAKDDLYGGNDEELAFGSTPLGAAQRSEQLKSLRPRPFPLERVFSIFATLVRLNPGINETTASIRFDGEDDVEGLMNSLGSTRLHTDVMYLIDTGYLHRASFQGSTKTEQISLSTAKFWCSLTKEEAVEISTRLGIPVEKYLI